MDHLIVCDHRCSLTFSYTGRNADTHFKRNPLSGHQSFFLLFLIGFRLTTIAPDGMRLYPIPT